MKNTVKSSNKNCHKDIVIKRLFFCLWVFFVLICFSISGLNAQTKDLNYYVNEALQNSPLFKDFQNRIVISRLDSLIHLATYKPQVNFSANNFVAPKINGWGYDAKIVNNGRYYDMLTVRQTIIGKDNKSTQLQSYTLENQSVQNTSKLSAQDLKLAVTTQYIVAYTISQEIVFSEEICELLKKEEAVLKKLTEAAIYKQTDYLNFLVGLKQQQLMIEQQKADYSNNIALLNYVCGIVDTESVRLADPNIKITQLPSFEKTLQFEQFRLDSLKIKNRDAMIDYAYRPKFDIYADAGFMSTLLYQPYKNFGASVGFSLVIPIYDGNKRKSQHSILNIAEQTRKNHLDFSRSQYQQKLAQLHQQLQSSEKIIEQAQEIVLYSQTMVEAYGKLLHTGDAAITDYILSINNYMNAKHVITQQTNNQLQIINQINYWNHEQ